jgi:hypothetical protein
LRKVILIFLEADYSGKINELSFKLIDHPPYSPGLAPLELHLHIFKAQKISEEVFCK